MRTISATEAKQSFAALLDTAQREPVVIRRHERDVAVLLSSEEYERMRDFYVRELEELCNRVSAQAKARGMNEAVLEDLLKDER
ncbi:MAG: type II toxin-antitoxin system Phd/YefM family antitoxin [Silvibacterium sp.]